MKPAERIPVRMRPVRVHADRGHPVRMHEADVEKPPIPEHQQLTRLQTFILASAVRQWLSRSLW